MKSKIKNLKLVISFLIISATLIYSFELALSFGVKNIKDGPLGMINMIIDHELDPEIAIFGSSVSVNGIDPRIIQLKTNKSCYNQSIIATFYNQYKCLLNEFNTYSQKNQIIVLVESIYSFEPKDKVSYLDYYLANFSNENIYNACHGIEPDLSWKIRYIPFYSFIPATSLYYKFAFKGWRNFIYGNHEIDSLRGYSPMNRGWEANKINETDSIIKFKININYNIINDYKNNIMYMNRLGKKVVIVFPPIFKEKINQYTDIKPLISVLKDVASSTNSIFLDFSSSQISSDKANFFNVNHLNLFGSKLFSNQLADSINIIVHKP
jgi:hypothetical protein